MSEKLLPHGRFDPALHDATAYVNYGDPTAEARNLRQNMVLGSFFTPFARDLYRKVVEDQPSGLIIPDLLPLRKPVLAATIHSDRTDSGLTVHLPTVLRSWPVNLYKEDLDVITPVGVVYGLEWSTAILNTTRAMYAVTRDKLTNLPSETPVVTRNKTFFQTPINTITDSINSAGQAVTQLTAVQRVTGFEQDPVGLVRRLIDAKVFNQFATAIPFGELGDMNRTGFVLDNILDLPNIRLSSFIRDYFATDILEDRYAQGLPTGFGCPVARGNTPTLTENGPENIQATGIDFVMRVFVEYLDLYYKNPELALPVAERGGSNA